MAVALKYTSLQAITLRLQKRAQVGGTPQTFGKDVIDPALVELVAPQVEARFEETIAHLYQTPLNLADPNVREIAASVVEKGILAEILPTQFFPDSGKEGGLRKVMADESARELEAVREGTIRLAGERPSSSAASMPPPSLKVSKRGSKNPSPAEQIQW